jgi:hypothetical protein
MPNDSKRQSDGWSVRVDRKVCNLPASSEMRAQLLPNWVADLRREALRS